MVSRGDIKPCHQAVQATHAALNLAYATGPPEKHPSLVHLVVPDQESLVEIGNALKTRDILVAEFEESYRDWGLTAIACYLGPNQRKLLSHLSLWTP